MLESISYDGNLAYKFKYDKQNRISKIIDYRYERCAAHLLTYNSAGDLVSKECKSSPPYYTDYDGTWTFTKDGTKIIIDRALKEHEHIELDNQRLPIERRQEYLGIYRKNIYEYCDNNISKITFEYVNIIHRFDYVTSINFMITRNRLCITVILRNGF